MPPSRPTAAAVDEEVTPRPIIKEEDLSKMDDIAHDAGWATHDDIDYNQKLAFSDDESTQEEEVRRDSRSQSHSSKEEKRSAERDRDSESSDRDERRGHASGPRPVEDEIWQERKRQHLEEVAIAVERAKQRKEEEEKRYQEQLKQAANKKLQQLEEKIRVKNTDNKEHVEEAAVPIPLPEWEKERELRDKERERESRDKDRSRTSSEGRDEKTVRDTRDVGSDFRQLTQSEVSFQ